MKKEFKAAKLAFAFGMVRTACGYMRKEEFVFALSDDAKKNKKTIDKFAKEYGLHLVEVWYRYSDAWDNVIHYKTYTYLPNITSEQLDKMKR